MYNTRQLPIKTDRIVMVKTAPNNTKYERDYKVCYGVLKQTFYHFTDNLRFAIHLTLLRHYLDLSTAAVNFLLPRHATNCLLSRRKTQPILMT